jgi:hypothetical protein
MLGLGRHLTRLSGQAYLTRVECQSRILTSLACQLILSPSGCTMRRTPEEDRFSSYPRSAWGRTPGRSAARAAERGYEEAPPQEIAFDSPLGLVLSSPGSIIPRGLREESAHRARRLAMAPSRCAYCGVLAEEPARLRWVVPGDPGEASVALTLRLCCACANSWCRTEPANLIRPAKRIPKKSESGGPVPGLPYSKPIGAAGPGQSSAARVSH